MAADTRPAPEGYLRSVLSDGARPFHYRSRIRSLMGLPDDEAVRVRFAAPVYAAHFPYVRLQVYGEYAPPANQITYIEDDFNNLSPASPGIMRSDFIGDPVPSWTEPQSRGAGEPEPSWFVPEPAQAAARKPAETEAPRSAPPAAETAKLSAQPAAPTADATVTIPGVTDRRSVPGAVLPQSAALGETPVEPASGQDRKGAVDPPGSVGGPQEPVGGSQERSGGSPKPSGSAAHQPLAQNAGGVREESSAPGSSDLGQSGPLSAIGQEGSQMAVPSTNLVPRAERPSTASGLLKAAAVPAPILPSRGMVVGPLQAEAAQQPSLSLGIAPTATIPSARSTLAPLIRSVRRGQAPAHTLPSEPAPAPPPSPPPQIIITRPVSLPSTGRPAYWDRRHLSRLLRRIVR